MATDRFNGVLASQAIKVPVRRATNVNQVLSGAPGSIDGYTFTDGERILLYGQTNPVENGIWDVNTTSDWSRAADFDGNRDATTSTLVVAERSVGAPVMWRLTNALPIIIGTDALTFEQYFDPASPAAADLQAVTDVGRITNNGIVFNSPLADASMEVDVANGGPAFISTASQLLISATGDVKTDSTFIVANLLGNAQVSIDVDELLEGPLVHIVANAGLDVSSVSPMAFSVGAGGNITFDIGANNALTIQDKVVRVNTDSGGYFEIRDDAGSYIRMEMGSAGLNIISDSILGPPDRLLFMPTPGGEGLAFMLYERAAARADVAGYGQFWVRSDTPNTPMFTDDAGTDHNLLTATGITRADIDSETFTDGFVLTADGAGGAFWEDLGVGTRTIAGSWTFTPGWGAAGNCLISRATDSFRYIAWRDVNTDRWALGFRDSANTDDFVITRTNSSGIFEDIPFTIKGSDGAAGGHIIIANDLTIGNMFFDNSLNLFRIGNGTDSVTMQQQTDITVFSFVGVNTFQLSGLAAGVIIQDGAYLRLNGPLDSAYVQFEHDDTDLNITENATGNIKFPAAGTLGLNMSDNELRSPVLRDYSIESPTEYVPTGTTQTLDYTLGPAFEVDLESVTDNPTITLSNAPPSGNYGRLTVKVTQDSAVARTITWAGGTFRWVDGAAHTMNPTLDGFSIFVFETWDGGAIWYAAGANYA
jgi:hypothetical protein